MRNKIIFLVILLSSLTQAYAGLKCENEAIAKAASTQNMTFENFIAQFENVVSHSEVDEMVVSETYVFQNKRNRNFEINISASAVKVLGKIRCSVRVLK